MSTTTIVGTVQTDPKLSKDDPHRPKYRTKFSVATTRQWRDERGVWRRTTTRVPVYCTGALARNVVLNVRKGDRIIAAGSLEQITWEKANGEAVSELLICANDLGVAFSHHRVDGGEFSGPDE
jgi:single-stranded DNA-binding protein